MQATYYHLHFIDEETIEHQNGRKDEVRIVSTCLQESSALEHWHHQTPHLWRQVTRDLWQVEWGESGWDSPLADVGGFFYFTSCPLIVYTLGCQEAKQNGKQLN